MAKVFRAIGQVAGTVATIAAFAGLPQVALIATPPSADYRARLVE